MLDVKKLLTKIISSYPMFGKTLWTGTWSTGTKTVPNTADYSTFIVVIGGTPAVCTNLGSAVDGSVMTSSTSSNNQYSKVFRATISGNVWTMVFSKQITHYASGNHSANSAQDVTQIIGLTPKWA